jgi:hypothetical protein
MVWGAMLGVALAPDGTVRTQQVVEQTVEPEAEFPVGFTRIRGLRELSDGRILLADQGERAVYLLDFTTGERVKVGREGSGPHEYKTPVGLAALRGDSSVLVDVLNSRFAILGPDGEIVETFSNRQFGYRMGGVRGDDHGHVYFNNRVIGSDGDRRMVMRWRRPEEVLDTLAFLEPADRFMSGGRSWPVPWTQDDAWSVGGDGRVAVVRRDPYRIEWIEHDGTVRRLPPVDYEPIPVGRADRDAWNEHPGIAMVGIGGPPKPPDDWDFPDNFPPFAYGGATITPEGTLWVERQQHVDETRPLFDVFDGEGRLVRRVRFPEGRDIVGFGRGVVYATREDADELLWLERYRR